MRGCRICRFEVEAIAEAFRHIASHLDGCYGGGPVTTHEMTLFILILSTSPCQQQQYQQQEQQQEPNHNISHHPNDTIIAPPLPHRLVLSHLYSHHGSIQSAVKSPTLVSLTSRKPIRVSGTTYSSMPSCQVPIPRETAEARLLPRCYTWLLSTPHESWLSIMSRRPWHSPGHADHSHNPT